LLCGTYCHLSVNAIHQDFIGQRVWFPCLHFTRQGTPSRQQLFSALDKESPTECNSHLGKPDLHKLKEDACGEPLQPSGASLDNVTIVGLLQPHVAFSTG